MNATLHEAAAATVRALRAAGLTVATAESCTGGMLAAALTGVAGASAVFRYGWVTYCNEAKVSQLGVPAELIAQHSVVSEPVAAAMAQGALRAAGADIAVGVTGNAGPTAAAGEPPVGTVCLGLARRAGTPHTETLFHTELDRNALRERATLRLLELMAEAARSGSEDANSVV